MGRTLIALALIALSVVPDAACAKGGGPLHLFRAGPPATSQPVSPNDLLGGC
jgi:hypothetical protein